MELACKLKVVVESGCYQKINGLLPYSLNTKFQLNQATGSRAGTPCGQGEVVWQVGVTKKLTANSQ